MTPHLTRYDCDIRHARIRPFTHAFAYRSPMWLVDLDRVPLLPKRFRFIGSIESRDHWSGNGSIRENIDAFLAANGAAPAAHIKLLTGARSFGHCFNPISIYWCYDADGRRQDVVVEVHNTYHGRHAYLLADDASSAETVHASRAGAIHSSVDKAFYVSPFMEGHGQYRMRISAPAESLDVLITLHQDGSVPFTASMRGTARAGSRWLFATRPLAQLRVVALIRWHGIKLWRRKLALQPRSGPGVDPAYVTGNLRDGLVKSGSQHTEPAAAPAETSAGANR